MNVSDLKHELDRLINLNLITENTEVRFAYQPNYPLYGSFSGTIHPGDNDGNSTVLLQECDVCGCDPVEEGFLHYKDCPREYDPVTLGADQEPASHVYLVEGGYGGGYASRKLWEDVEVY